MKDSRSFYMPELDILRAFAFFGVFVSHWIPREPGYYVAHGFPNAVGRALAAVSCVGSLGVMVFFSLSSFLITSLLLKEIKSRGEVHVGAFYMRRILRIWPLYLLFTGVAAALPLLDSSQRFGWKATVAFLFFSGNWIWSLGVPVNTVATPLWSISVEEQFYLCWPWVVRKATSRGLRNTAFVLIGLAALNRLAVVTKVVPWDLWHCTITQFDAIALGALLAIGVFRRADAWKAKARGPIIFFALAGLYLAQFATTMDQIAPISMVYYPFVELCCAAILWATIGAALDSSSGFVRAGVSLGRVSYGLYVFHNFGFYLTNKLFALIPFKVNYVAGFFGRGAVALLVTVGFALFSYRYLEQPFLALKSRFSLSLPGRRA